MRRRMHVWKCTHTHTHTHTKAQMHAYAYAHRILIDLDASCKIGEPAGQKVTSSAFFPPEMARYELEKASGSVVEEVIAR